MTCLRSVCARSRASRILCLAAAVGVGGWLAAARADTFLPGSTDSSFAPNLRLISLYAVALDSQERIFVGGDNRVFARLNNNGVEDASFVYKDFGGVNRVVYGLAVDRLDRVYVVGGFNNQLSNTKSVNVTRFLADGTQNTPFDPGTGANSAIVSVLLQPTDSSADNDRVIVGGLFTKFRGETRARLARLTTQGFLDSGFDPNLNVNGNVYALALQKDPSTGLTNGEIVVGGAFSKVNGSNHSRLARVRFDGSLDESFAPQIDDDVFAIDVQPDGKVVIGGQFGNVNGNAARGLARLNADGSFDSTFAATISGDENQGTPPEAVYALRLQADGRVVVAGNFLRLNDQKRRFFGRLNGDGSVDATFDPEDNISDRGEAIAIQADNRIIVGEVASKPVDTVTPKVIARVYGGSLLSATGAPAVSLTAGQNAIYGETKGSFFVSRAGAGDLSQPLTVLYAVKSNGVQAKEGVSFAPMSGVATIPAGATQVKIKVKPMSGSGGAKLKLQLKSDAAYSVAGTGKASIRLK